jgi:hypothetical protein
VLPPRARARLRIVIPRLPTAHARAVPDFLLIGAHRSGSTSVFTALSEHPQVIAPPLKELHHFDHDRPWPFFLYRCYFPTKRALRRRARQLGAPVITGEGTPNYLFHPEAPRRIARALPTARFVVILREPTERARSHLALARNRGWTDETSLRAAVEWGSGVFAKPRGPREHWRRYYGHTAFYERGLYAEQFERWLDVVPPERMLILRLEDWRRSPEAVFAQVCEFLGIDPTFRPSLVHANRGDERPVTDDERSWLRTRYREPNERLQELVGIRWPVDQE